MAIRTYYVEITFQKRGIGYELTNTARVHASNIRCAAGRALTLCRQRETRFRDVKGGTVRITITNLGSNQTDEDPIVCRVKRMRGVKNYGLLTPKEAAQHLQMDRFSVYRAIWGKRLLAFRKGGQWRIPCSEIRKFQRRKERRTRGCGDHRIQRPEPQEANGRQPD